ncbi:MAG TPA: GNAT family N-acetyltransferase [Candidatus Sulfopaludibacter sp.]|nr:GNAT family N-acetyltransferase [Candidatus Sulfopaludibacter sp.]
MPSSAPIKTRRATEADVPTVLGFIQALAEYEKLASAVTANEEVLRKHLFGPNTAAEVLLAESEGQTVGFACYFQTFSTFVGRPGLWLEDILVLPQHRGRGVGRILLREVAKIAFERNAGRLEWSVLDWNTPAIEFYKKVGAVPMSDWTTYRVTGEALRRLAVGVAG